MMNQISSDVISTELDALAELIRYHHPPVENVEVLMAGFLQVVTGAARRAGNVSGVGSAVPAFDRGPAKE